MNRLGGILLTIAVLLAFFQIPSVLAAPDPVEKAWHENVIVAFKPTLEKFDTVINLFKELGALHAQAIDPELKDQRLRAHLEKEITAGVQEILRLGGRLDGAYGNSSIPIEEFDRKLTITPVFNRTYDQLFVDFVVGLQSAHHKLHPGEFAQLLKEIALLGATFGKVWEGKGSLPLPIELDQFFDATPSVMYLHKLREEFISGMVQISQFLLKEVEAVQAGRALGGNKKYMPALVYPEIISHYQRELHRLVFQIRENCEKSLARDSISQPLLLAPELPPSSESQSPSLGSF